MTLSCQRIETARARTPRRTGAAIAGVFVVLLSTTARAQSDEALRELERAYALKAQGDYTEAASAFERAGKVGAPSQLVALELAYVAAATGSPDTARRYFAEAERGDDAELSLRAKRELAAITPASPPAGPLPHPPAAPVTAPPSESSAALAEAYRSKAAGNLAGATAAFERAKAAGADAQRVALELGYLAVASGDDTNAHARFTEAERGPDADLGEQARRQRGVLPRHIYADAYADAFGWNRISGDTINKAIIVPSLRVRGFYRPSLSTPIELYVSGQATRDTESRGFSNGALPKIYSDNYAIFGGGLRVRLWNKRIELFAQAGPAANLLEDGRDRVALDVRGGAVGYAETAKCAPAPHKGVRASFWPCLEAYAQVVYVSRYQHDVVGFATPRASAGYLLIGPVLWQATAQVRVAKDTNNDYWNNFADAGLGHRWRLLAPFRVDLLLTADAGTYFGLAGRDPAPSRLTYVDVRGLVATYVEF